MAPSEMPTLQMAALPSVSQCRPHRSSYKHNHLTDEERVSCHRPCCCIKEPGFEPGQPDPELAVGLLCFPCISGLTVLTSCRAHPGSVLTASWSAIACGFSLLHLLAAHWHPGRGEQLGLTSGDLVPGGCPAAGHS